MTSDLLERAIAISRDLPVDRQEEIARILFDFAELQGDIDAVSPEDEAAAHASRAAADHGDYATDDEMRVLRSKYGM